MKAPRKSENIGECTIVVYHRRNVLLVALITLLVLFLTYTFHFIPTMPRSTRTLPKKNKANVQTSYFAICTIVKNEDNLAQWIEYHYRLGCDKFYIYDNNSTYNIRSTIQTYIERGIVQFHSIRESDTETMPNTTTLQLFVFNQWCIKEHSRKHVFMGFVDSDEFIVLPGANSMANDVTPNSSITTVRTTAGKAPSTATPTGSLTAKIDSTVATNDGYSKPQPHADSVDRGRAPPSNLRKVSSGIHSAATATTPVTITSTSTMTTLPQTIPQVLKQFEAYGGVTLNWMMFGSSGHIHRPPGGVIEHYSKCVRNLHIKTIVNTKYVLRDNGTPHGFIYADGQYAVDTNFYPVDGPFNPPPGRQQPAVTQTTSAAKSGGTEKQQADSTVIVPDISLYRVMYINHYHMRSLEDFRNKMIRGRFNKAQFSLAYFQSVDALAVDACPVLLMPPPRK